LCNLGPWREANVRRFINHIFDHCWLCDSGGHYIGSVRITHRCIWDVSQRWGGVGGINRPDRLMNQFINAALVLKWTAARIVTIGT
jgi:hypothetical protein